MQHTHYCNEPLEIFSVVRVSVTDTEHIQRNRISMRRCLLTAGTQMISNGQQAELCSPLKLGTYVRTKGCFACMDATVCSRILHRHVASCTSCLYHTFRCQRRHKTIALINV